MPERPDLEYVVPRLDAQLRGKTVRAVTVKKPVVLRVAVEGKFEELVAGKTFGKIVRRSHMVIFPIPPLEMVVVPMLAGRFQIAEPASKAPADTAVTFDLGPELLRYRDDVQMGKVYVIPAGKWELVPGMPKIGLDVLDKKVFTKAAFRALAKKRRDQVKVFLMDKTALDSFGNAYADETLFAAGLHPKTMRSTSPAWRS
jgi:formamidopyrimidine-DNA glycosylase